MSLSEGGQRAAFAAWAATEGITKVGFNPVEAAGITVGHVWGVRDHHLVLLDREWGIWVASQRSRAAVEASPSAGEKEAKIANERDRTVVARCLTAFDRAVAARGWLTQGRGPYEWDDDRFYAEFGHAIDEFRKSVEPLRRIAIDMTNVPKDNAGVDAGKVDAAELIGEPPVATAISDGRKTLRVSDEGTFFVIEHDGKREVGWKHGEAESVLRLLTRAMPEATENDHGLGKCLPVDGVEFDRRVAGREQDERENWLRTNEIERCVGAVSRLMEVRTCGMDLRGLKPTQVLTYAVLEIRKLQVNACPLCESTDPSTLLVPCVRMLERTGKVDPWHPQRKPS